MIQLKDKLKVNGGTRRYMEMIGLSLAFSLFAVSCTQDSDTFYPSSPEEEHPSVDESRMIPIQLSVDGVDQFYGGAVTRSGETVARLVQPLDSTYDTGYDGDPLHALNIRTEIVIIQAVVFHIFPVVFVGLTLLFLIKITVPVGIKIQHQSAVL